MAAGRRAVVSEPSEQGLYPAEHRALRELHAMARQLASHWARLGGRLGGAPGDALRDGAVRRARAAARAGRPHGGQHGLHGFPAAQGVGARLAGAAQHRRRPRCSSATRRCAPRCSTSPHVTTLLAYLVRARRPPRRRHARRLAPPLGGAPASRRRSDAIGDAVVALAEDPDDAILPASQTAARPRRARRRERARHARRGDRRLAGRPRRAQGPRRLAGRSTPSPSGPAYGLAVDRGARAIDAVDVRPVMQAATSAVLHSGARAQPQADVLQRRRRDDPLPAARAEHRDPVGLAQRDQRAGAVPAVVASGASLSGHSP